MTEHRRSFKRIKSLSEDSGSSFQASNFSISSGGGIHSSKLNNDSSLNSGSEFRTPLLNRLKNQSATNSGSSSSTIGGSSICGSVILPSITTSNHILNNQDNLNYCEVYYLSPSKQKSKKKIHYSSEQNQSHQLQRRSFQKNSNETNYATLQQSHTPKIVQKQSLHDSLSGSWATNAVTNILNKSNAQNLIDISSVKNSSTGKQRSIRQNKNNSVCSNKPQEDRSPEIWNSATTRSSVPTSSLGYIGLRTLSGISAPSQVDQNLDNFDVCSHYSDSVAIITKNQPPGTMQFIKNSSGGRNIGNSAGSRSNNVTFSDCTEEHYLHRHRSPSFSNYLQFQQQQQKCEIGITASGTLTKPTTPHLNRGSLRRSKERSNQSLCSCDVGASTEIVPDPNRPLYQYSLDRKKRKHTYTCEQNAQILMRLEREKHLRNNSCGNLTVIPTPGKSSSKKSLDKQSDAANDVDIPPPPPPPSVRKLSFKGFHDNFVDGFTIPSVEATTKPQFHLQNLNTNYQLHHPTTNTVSFSISNSNINVNNNCINNKKNNNNLNTNNNNNNNNNNDNSKNDNNNNNNNIINNSKNDNNNNNNNNNSNKNNNKINSSNNSFKSTNNAIDGILDCNLGEKMLNDCTSTILNCANVGQLMDTSAIASTSTQSTPGTIAFNNFNSNKPDLCQMGSNSKSNAANATDKYGYEIKEHKKHQQHHEPNQHSMLSDNNGNMKRLNQENIPFTPYPFVRDDSYLPCFKNSNNIKSSASTTAEESVFFFHQEPPQYKPNFDNRPSLQNNFGNETNSKYNTIGPSNCYAKQLTSHYHSNDFCNFSHFQGHQTKRGISNNGIGVNGGEIDESDTICNGGTNLINERSFSQSLTNFAFAGSGIVSSGGNDGNHFRGPFDDRTDDINDHRHWHSHNCHDFAATVSPYAQFRIHGGTDLSSSVGVGGTGISNSTTTVNGGLSCSFDNSLISCSFTTIGSGNSGLKGINNIGGKDQLHKHSFCSNLKGSSTGLSGSSGASLMPWKHRQCPSRGSSSSGTNSLRFDFAKHWLAVSSLLLLIGAASVAVPLALRVAASAPFEERLQIATQILETVPLIDGHNDLPWNIRKFLHNKLNDFNFDEDLRNVTPWAKSQWSHTDLQRLRSGRVSAQFWAAYVPCEAQHRDAVQLTLEQIDVIKRLTERYSVLTTCTSASDIIEAHKNHKLCSLTGVEGGHSLGGSLAVLRTLYAIGVRYMTLTSTCHTPWADSSYADAPTFNVKHGGLTSFGKIYTNIAKPVKAPFADEMGKKM